MQISDQFSNISIPTHRFLTGTIYRVCLHVIEWLSDVSGKDGAGEAVMTGGEPFGTGFRSDKESGQWNSISRHIV